MALTEATFQEIFDSIVPDANKMVLVVGGHDVNIAIIDDMSSNEAYLISGNSAVRVILD